MNIEDIIRAWKSSEAELQPSLPANPVGYELSEKEMLEVIGGEFCVHGSPTSNCNINMTAKCIETCLLSCQAGPTM